MLLEPVQKRIDHKEAILDEIKENKNSALRIMLSDYPSIDNDNDKISTFRSFSKVHELKSSTREFIDFQKRVNSSESSDYVRGKNHLEFSHNRLRSIRKI